MSLAPSALRIDEWRRFCDNQCPRGIETASSTLLPTTRRRTWTASERRGRRVLRGIDDDAIMSAFVGSVPGKIESQKIRGMTMERSSFLGFWRLRGLAAADQGSHQFSLNGEVPALAVGTAPVLGQGYVDNGGQISAIAAGSAHRRPSAASKLSGI